MTFPSPARQAFSLIELLTVVAIVALLTGLTVPVLRTLGDARDVGQTVYQIADVLRQARAQAMARNTYVAVGFATQEETTPAPPAQDRFVVLSSRISTDGRRPSDWNSDAAALNLGKIYRFDRTTLAAVASSFGGTKQNPDVRLDAISGGSHFTRRMGGQTVSFSRVVEFGPTGEMRVVGQSLNRLTELGLASANRPDDPASSAALQIAGLTGTVRVFRP
ncbi:MAG: prepilin-type N-terminal cleavage/methylation domain-containing protein [Terrimicrobiaceae bacterium]|nr:prepilin-type N-terminal cleavage/methylation domain-containing protein [Terrimicrobiaceae bacterium]